MKNEPRENLNPILPNDIAVEMAALGAMMLSEQAASAVFEILKDDDFFKESHRKIFLAGRKIFLKNEPVDLHTVAEALNAAGQLEEIGGSSYLADVVGSVASPAHAENHSRIILRKSILRRTINACTRTIQEAHKEPDDVDAMLSKHEAEIMGIGGGRKSRMKIFGGVAVEILEDLENMKNNPGGVSGVATGFTGLDSITSGFQKGDYILIAGRPSNGKTALASNILRYTTFIKKIPAGIFSMEASSQTIGIRMVCLDCGVDSQKIRNGHASNDDYRIFAHRLAEISNVPLLIDDTPGLNLFELKSRCRQMVDKLKVELIVVDYLGLMDMQYRSGASKEQATSDLSRGLKNIAKELNVPLIALAQLSRKSEDRGGRPILSDLKDSGSLEADADVVILIHWLGRHKPESTKEEDQQREIIIAKHRNGRVGMVTMNFDPFTGRFTTADYLRPEPAQNRNITGEREDELPY